MGVGWLKKGSGLVKNGCGLVKNGSGLVKKGSGLVKNGSGLVKNGSGLVKNGSGLVKNGCGLVKNGCGLVKNGSGLAKNESGLITNGSGLVKNGSGLVKFPNNQPPHRVSRGRKGFGKTNKVILAYHVYENCRSHDQTSTHGQYRQELCGTNSCNITGQQHPADHEDSSSGAPDYQAGVSLE